MRGQPRAGCSAAWSRLRRGFGPACVRAVMPACAHRWRVCHCVVRSGAHGTQAATPPCTWRHAAPPMRGVAAAPRCCATGVWQRPPGTPRGRAWCHRHARLCRLHRARQAPPRRVARGALTQPWLPANSFAVMSENWLIDLFRACFGSALCRGTWAWGRGTATSKTHSMVLQIWPKTRRSRAACTSPSCQRHLPHHEPRGRG